MTFVDASAIVAILGREPGHEELEKRLAMAAMPLIVSPLVKFEATMALARQKVSTGAGHSRSSPESLRQARAAVEAFAEDLDVEEIPISSEIGAQAIEASARYGKAVGHVADLNFGDCFAYACAKTLGAELIYKGNDFVHTDLA